MTFGVLVTNNGTHSAEKWADAALDQLISLQNTSPETLVKVGKARIAIKPHLLALLQQARTHERGFLGKMLSHEREHLVEGVKARVFNGGGDHHKVDFLHHHVDGVKTADDHVEEHYDAVKSALVGLAKDGVGDIATDDEIKAFLCRWTQNVLTTERQHFVTSQNLHE
jgi:hypothetical protein